MSRFKSGQRGQCHCAETIWRRSLRCVTRRYRAPGIRRILSIRYTCVRTASAMQVAHLQCPVQRGCRADNRAFTWLLRERLTAARWLSAHEINHRRPRRGTDQPFGTDVAQIAIKENGGRKANTLNVIARETYEMNSVALLTPTYGRDLELCTLL